jgi:hypothetical protein
MGTDIAGWIEVNAAPDFLRDGLWLNVIDVGSVVGRSYDLYACLFGIRNYAQFPATLRRSRAACR